MKFEPFGYQLYSNLFPKQRDVHLLRSFEEEFVWDALAANERHSTFRMRENSFRAALSPMSRVGGPLEIAVVWGQSLESWYVSVLMVASAALASDLPARRAAAAKPVEALRAE